MRDLCTLVLLASTSVASAQSITTTDLHTFSPDLLTVQAGTDINVTVGAGHTMTEVGEATWNANGDTPNGGFDFGFGNHVLNLTTPGTYYYVCQPHSSMGMKGRIIVETGTGVAENPDGDTFQIFPNPASDGITVSLGGRPGMVLRLIDVQGREVLRHRLTGDDRISVAHLAKGGYTALLEDANGTTIARRPLTLTR